jgi:hypothetical protein
MHPSPARVNQILMTDLREDQCRPESSLENIGNVVTLKSAQRTRVLSFTLHSDFKGDEHQCSGP